MKNINSIIHVLSAKLSQEERDALPDSDFALSNRRYPIHDKQHAVAALWLVTINGTDKEKSIVRKAVAERYPSIKPKE